MDVQKLKAEHPDVAEALINEGREAGATAERERIQAVEAQSMPGHEALVATLKFDGKTSGPEAAVQVLAAEKKKKGDTLANLRADADAAAVSHAAAPDPADPNEDDEDDEDENDSKAVAARAVQHQKDMKAKGVKVSTAEAVAHVTKQIKEARHG